MINKIFDSVFGSYNEKELKKYKKILHQIKSEYEKITDLNKTELQKKFQEWRKELTKDESQIDKKLPEIFAGIIQATHILKDEKATPNNQGVQWDMVPYDVQILGGIAIHHGRITEMKTGEGKTFVCTLPSILNALTGKGVHIITVNDYLAQRDAEWMRPLYEFCGISVACITHDKTPPQRQEAYQSDITYGTNNEFGFDYLRDNMCQSVEQIVQRNLYFAIVDEVDSILIDEARTPLIISAPAEESTEKYKKYSQLISRLTENEDFNVDIKLKSATLSDSGIAKMEQWLGVNNIFTEKGFEEVQHIEQALKSHYIFKKDQDYVVRDGDVIIVDEFTGRLMAGRRYSDGLHQSIEAKEGVEIKKESKTLATITFQNYFRLYEKLSGMTGTAESEAEEFAKIYQRQVVSIPTHNPIQRADHPDKIFKNEIGKFKHLIKVIKELNTKGQPILIGTIHIEKSELLSKVLNQNGLKHEVLNAKNHSREAEIVANAGQKGAITIATNMAGRGTDIKLGEGVAKLGGLAILGTERHESRRIDNQLRGRSGRQGDPGFSQFFVSMADDLMRRFGGEKMAQVMEKLGLPEDEPIQNKLISRTVESAQKRIEGFHFDTRKHIVQYDNVMNIHREKIYALRQSVLFQEDNEGEIIQDMIEKFTLSLREAHLPTEEFSTQWNTLEISETLHGLAGNTSLEKIQEDMDQFTYQKDVQEYIKNYLLEALQKQQSKWRGASHDNIIRIIIVKSIDELWLNHINKMTSLRDQVALSGYAQKDPIMEYKKEGYLAFAQLIKDIRFTAISNLLRVNVTNIPAEENFHEKGLTTNEAEIINNLTHNRQTHTKTDNSTNSRADRRRREREKQKSAKKGGRS